MFFFYRLFSCSSFLSTFSDQQDFAIRDVSAERSVATKTVGKKLPKTSTKAMRVYVVCIVNFNAYMLQHVHTFSV